MIWIHKSMKNIISTTHTGAKEQTKDTGRGKSSLFGLSAPEEGRVEENENSYNQLQEN
jgi:hypothetical protein